MANEEHVEIVKQGKEAILAFRKENPDVRLDLSEADLNGADLSSSNLTTAFLRGADLSKANLKKSNLGGTDMRRAIVTEADLGRSNLRSANLSRADLSEADLSKANLLEVNLIETILIRANLTGVHFGETTIADVDLSSAKGLAEVKHGAPSSIGIDTLYKSKGKIPDVFLRGCGVPEEFITFVPSLTAKPFEFYSCFISYGHEDKKFARRLHDALQGRGIRCWLDEHQIRPGDDLHEEIDRGIKLWDKVLLCGSQDSLTSWWVDNEIDKAFKKEARLMKERKKKTLALIPLDLDGYLFDEWENGKKDQVLSRGVAKFKGWKRNNDRFEEAFEQVVQALRTDDFREHPPKPKL